jgi:hypothetical protein
VVDWFERADFEGLDIFEVGVRWSGRQIRQVEGRVSCLVMGCDVAGRELGMIVAAMGKDMYFCGRS